MRSSWLKSRPLVALVVVLAFVGAACSSSSKSSSSSSASSAAGRDCDDGRRPDVVLGPR